MAPAVCHAATLGDRARRNTIGGSAGAVRKAAEGGTRANAGATP